MGPLGPLSEEVTMLGRRRRADPWRTAAGRLEVRRMYPAKRARERSTKGVAPGDLARGLAHRMKLGMQRLVPILGSVARDGLAQFLRASPSGRHHDHK